MDEKCDKINGVNYQPPSFLNLLTVYRHFRITSFRRNQAEIINAAMEGNDVFVLMPTGAGKSICYQVCFYHIERDMLSYSFRFQRLSRQE